MGVVNFYAKNRRYLVDKTAVYDLENYRLGFIHRHITQYGVIGFEIWSPDKFGFGLPRNCIIAFFGTYLAGSVQRCSHPAIGVKRG
jgi:hypothetical protein